MRQEGHPHFYRLLTEIGELHSRKNSDYASATDPLSNLRQSERIGIPGWVSVIVRLMDKWDRIIQLTNKKMAGQAPAVTDESLIDTLKDAAVYELLAIILLEEDRPL